MLSAIAHQSERRIQCGIISHVFRDIGELGRSDPEAVGRIGVYKQSTIPPFASSMINGQAALSALEGPKDVTSTVVPETVKRGRGWDKSNVSESERQSKRRRLLEEDQTDRKYNGRLSISFFTRLVSGRFNEGWNASTSHQYHDPSNRAMKPRCDF